LFIFDPSLAKFITIACFDTNNRRRFPLSPVTKNPLHLKLEAQWAEPVSLIFHSVLSKLYTEPYIGASYQVSAQRASGEISISLLTELSSLNKEFIIIIIIIWPKQELSVAAMLVNGSGRNEQSILRTFHRCFLQSFGSFGNSVSKEKIFRNQPIRNKNCLWWPCLLTNRDEMNILYRGPTIDTSYQVSVHLAKWFQRRRFFRNRSIRNKNCLWSPCLLTNRAEMSNLHRGPLAIDASYQVSVHLAKRFRRRIILRNQPIRNKNCLWQPCF
jgi:hypothetical protein